MSNSTRLTAVATALASLGLILGGCGSEPSTTGSATLEVASLPTAEVSVDGVSKGTTPLTIDLPAGKYELGLAQPGFQAHREAIDLAAGSRQTVETILVPENPDDPKALAMLGQAFDVEVNAFEEPPRHRGASDADVLLLWPREDMRQVGLNTFAIEVGTEYQDGRVEFYKGKTLLFSAPFDPENAVTVGAIPAEVIKEATPGANFTWGVYFSDKRAKPITAKFEILSDARADKVTKKIEKLEGDRRLAKEPPVVRDVLVAKELENYRLYAEALVKNLETAQKFPNSIQPFQGIVTTMRRLEIMDSSLFVAVSPFVGGKGGHGRALAGGGSGGEARLDAEVERFIPSVVIDTGRLAVLNDPLRSGATPLGAGGAVRPGIRGAGTPEGAAGGGTTEGTAGGGGDTATVPVGNREVLQGRLDALTQQAEAANQNLANAQAGAQEALENVNALQQDIEGQQATVESLEQAQTAAAEALAAAEASGDAAAIQTARDDLTRAQRSAQEARARLTGMFDQLARAQMTLDQAQNALIAADQQAHDLAQQIAQTQRALEHSPGGTVPPTTPEQQADQKAKEQALKDAEAGFAEAQATAIAAHAAYETAQADLEAARAAFEATPSDLNRHAFEQAELAFQKAAEEYSMRMDAARDARNAVLELTALLRQLQIAPR